MQNDFFDDNFLDALPDDEDLAGILLCNRFLEKVDSLSAGQQYAFALKALGLLRGYCKAHYYQLETLDVKKISESRGRVRDQRKPIVEAIKNCFLEMQQVFDANVLERELQQIGEFEDYYTLKFSDSFEYNLEAAEVDRIHQLIQELQLLIEQTEQVDEHCRRRLLTRLERFRAELRPKMAALDSFFAFFGELGHSLGKFGANIKPLSERAREINRIVLGRKKQAAPVEEFTAGMLLPDA